jgi:hypothetical protein
MPEPRAPLARSHLTGSASLFPRKTLRRTPWLRPRYGQTCITQRSPGRRCTDCHYVPASRAETRHRNSSCARACALQLLHHQPCRPAPAPARVHAPAPARPRTCSHRQPPRCLELKAARGRPHGACSRSCAAPRACLSIAPTLRSRAALQPATSPAPRPCSRHAWAARALLRPSHRASAREPLASAREPLARAAPPFARAPAACPG